MMLFARLALLSAALLASCALWAEMPYSGAKPAKKDLPYLVLGNRLVETEQAEASQAEVKNRTTYTVQGASSSARTPLAEPAFLLLPGEMKPESLSLYAMKVEKGVRSLSFSSKPRKDDPRSIPLLFHPRKDGTMMIESNQYLDPGEYCLSPQGANTVFCFQVY
ncbi:MAG: hypothetical protein MUF01_13400 [Bryobacterales bacterium]|jgi:hypothetical protein|nr:hypothetical protein [Bryobacterales bacterium]